MYHSRSHHNSTTQTGELPTTDAYVLSCIREATCASGRHHSFKQWSFSCYRHFYTYNTLNYTTKQPHIASQYKLKWLTIKGFHTHSSVHSLDGIFSIFFPLVLTKRKTFWLSSVSFLWHKHCKKCA